MPVTSSIYMRALLRGTTLRPLMEADAADANLIGLNGEIPDSSARERYLSDFYLYILGLYIKIKKQYPDENITLI